MTIRQLFYRLISNRTIENCLGDYQRLSKALTKARNNGRIRFDQIVDRSRQTYEVCAYEDLAEYSRVMLNCYRRDNWQDQPCHVAVWTEKDAITGAIEEITDNLPSMLLTSLGLTCRRYG